MAAHIRFYGLVLIFLSSGTVSRAQDCRFTNVQRVQQQVFQQNLWGDGNAHRVSYATNRGTRNSISDIADVPVIGAMNIWVGGKDAEGNVLVAAGTYTHQSQTDWYAGPLTADGEPTETCSFWDQVFTVTKEDIRQAYRTLYDTEGELKSTINCNDIPSSVLNWPGSSSTRLQQAVGEMVGSMDFASFFDLNGNGMYEPCLGDLPTLRPEGCDGPWQAEGKEIIERVNSFPENLSYWLMNDNGGSHELTGGLPLKIEVHNYTYHMSKEDQKNTIYWKYDLRSKNTEQIDSLIFSTWIDYELGCDSDDFMGSHPENDLVYFYNGDDVDGSPLDSCSFSGEVFEEVTPIFGFGILKSLNADIRGSRMSSAVGYDTNEKPVTDIEHYYLMQGLYVDGSRFSDNEGNDTKYLFYGDPGSQESWSQCQADRPVIRSVVVSAGIGSISIGQELEVLTHLAGRSGTGTSGCPREGSIISQLDKNQFFYDNCFNDYVGPTAPDLVATASSGAIRFAFDNDVFESNNRNQDYFELDFEFGQGANGYHFEGYQVFQVASADFDISRLRESIRNGTAKYIYNGDIENGVKDIFNYVLVYDPSSLQSIYVPDVEPYASADNQGIPAFFEVSIDRILMEPLREDGIYHFVVLAYAFNTATIDFSFNISDQFGVTRPYLASRDNVKVTTVDMSTLSTSTTDIEALNITTWINGFSLESDEAMLLQLYSFEGKIVDTWSLKSKGDIKVSNLQEANPTGMYVLIGREETGKVLFSRKVVVAD